ncbi:MAG: thiosulfate sulfurtransferase [Sedimenticola sp.]|nr:MAG: thiosulfate sulfurtransferase [Sedimenticola sp.]
MTDTHLPLLLEPRQLQPLLGSQEILVVDLSKASVHDQVHIPGAVFLDYANIVAAKKPVMGLLPDSATLERVFAATGIDNDQHIIAYDDEGGGKAARLLWTLECMGHSRFSLLNGGLHAWVNEQYPRSDTRTPRQEAHFTATPDNRPIAEAEYILQRLGDSGTVMLDARSADEYTGARRFAQRGGHIPGAVNVDWTVGMDQTRNLRMRGADELLPLLAGLGITPEKEIISYCQTHHRSSYSYIMLKILGFEQIKGYPGSWSDWGNRNDTPIE